MNIAELRREYRRAVLDLDHLTDDPMSQFRRWLDEAVQAEALEPNAFVLATVGDDTRPSARVVLVKDADERGITFYTNYESEKARHLAQNPKASCVFFWAELERQVRLFGNVEKVSREESEEYFRTRPRENRLGAWASPQSRPVQSREVIEVEFLQLNAKYPGDNIPLPPFWGGYRVLVNEAEFWQGRPNRLHDRFRYRKRDDGKWHIERLAP